MVAFTVRLVVDVLELAVWSSAKTLVELVADGSWLELLGSR